MKHTQGIAIALFVLAAYIAAARIDAPSETDSLQRSADISNQLAAEAVAMKE